MTDDTCRDVLARYEERVEDELETSAACDELRHVSTMLPQMRAMLDKADRDDFPVMPWEHREKFMRWLGFVQGVFWCRSVYTIEEMKQHNRPSETAHRG